ncbi:lipopolysaccharide biosynthesis protein [Granulicella tundricola]|uniref:Polysaccharide biosynthesis protein n=1 Tax=Granulicella tundricola (strain ATCC BAA-1859 / DSM 23138 / MP5ACTX9) TaxID=1198114 RepID=E8X6T4_GRATM|nr:oligosaccharide flippase family protein [Granulicella tundricola]ADW71234.1 polysaccharide biosynthesis protein [Granulicella tundricola MP5ACTX9]
MIAFVSNLFKIGGRLRIPSTTRLTYALLDQGVVSFGNMVISAAVARHTPNAEFGVFILSLRSLDFINQICGVLIWGPYIFNMPGLSEERKKPYLGSVLTHQVVGCVLGVVTLLLLALLLNHHGEQYRQLFAPLALPSVAIVFREFTRRMYFAQMSFRAAFIADAITVAVQTTSVLLLLHSHRLHSTSAVWALSLACVPASLFWLFSNRRRFSFGISDCRDDLRLNMQLGRWFFGSNMTLLVGQQANPWILSAMRGPTAVAGYAVCEAVVNIPRVALTSMQNTMGPSMARAYAGGGKDSLRRVVRRHSTLIIGGTMVFVVGIVVAGPAIAKLIYHLTPPDAHVILILLACNLLAYGASLGTSYGLSAINQARLNFLAAVAGLVVQLALAYVLVNRTGATGAAAALLAGSIIVLLVQTGFYVREMRRA